MFLSGVRKGRECRAYKSRARYGCCVGWGRGCDSEAGPFLQRFGVARALDRDVRRGGCDVAEVVGRQLDRDGADVLIESCELRGPGNRRDPWLLGEQPCERDLRRRRPLFVRDLPQDIHDRLICLARFRREAQHEIAEIGAHERRLLVDRARQEAFAEWTEGHEADAELLEGWQQLFFGTSPPQGVFALDRSDRLDGVGAADRAHAGFGHAEVLHFALRDQFLDRPRHVFDRHRRVDAMLVVEIHDVGFEPFQRTLDALPDALGATVLHLLPVLVFDAELGRDHDLLAHWRQRLPDELFISMGPVDLRRIEEGGAAFHGGADERDHRLFVGGDAVALAHAHAAEAEGGDFEARFAEFAERNHRGTLVSAYCRPSRQSTSWIKLGQGRGWSVFSHRFPSKVLNARQRPTRISDPAE